MHTLQSCVLCPSGPPPAENPPRMCLESSATTQPPYARKVAAAVSHGCALSVSMLCIFLLSQSRRVRRPQGKERIGRPRQDQRAPIRNRTTGIVLSRMRRSSSNARLLI